MACGWSICLPKNAPRCASRRRAFSRHADGVIVGGAVVRAVEQAKDRAQAVASVQALVKNLASGLSRA
jgi:tryptophan synthase alpha subunit